MSPRAVRHLIYLTAVLLAGAGSSLGAQITVDLEVVDADSGLPVENTVVRIPGLNVSEITDSLGRATLEALTAGTFRIILTRMGYEPLGGDFTVDRAGSFRLALTPVLLRLDAEPGQINGRVVAAEDEAGLSGAVVSIVGTSLRRTTDGSGWFTIEDVPAGANAITVERFGRQTLHDSVFVGPGETLQVLAPLPVEAIEIEGFEVTASSRFLTQSGFFRRQQQLDAFQGAQWMARDISARNVGSLGELVQDLPGVMRTMPIGGAPYNSYERFRCRFALYVDSFRMEPWFDLESIDPDRVEAMEVFYGSLMPARYMNHCGVILVWLERGRR